MAALALLECAVPEACAFLWWVMVVGGLFSLQPTVTAPQGSAAGGWGLLSGSVTEEALGQEAGGQGYSLETGRTWRPLEVAGGQHTEGPGSCRVSSHRASIVRVVFRACSAHRLQTTAFTGHPRPLRAEATAGGRV